MLTTCKPVEFGQNRGAPPGQILDSPLHIGLARFSGFLWQRLAHVGDSRRHLPRVFLIQRDGFAVVVQHATGDGWRDGAKDNRRNARQL